MSTRPSISSFFFFNDTATTEIYTLSLHDALPISQRLVRPLRDQVPHLLLVEPQPHERVGRGWQPLQCPAALADHTDQDRKSTRLNSSHLVISYAVFCLKKKKKESSYSL